jgi:glutathione S-transferase
MTPTLLEFVVAAMLLWVAWQIGLALTPHVVAYFRRITRPAKPEPTAADRAAEAFRAVASEPPHGHDR